MQWVDAALLPSHARIPPPRWNDADGFRHSSPVPLPRNIVRRATSAPPSTSRPLFPTAAPRGAKPALHTSGRMLQHVQSRETHKSGASSTLEAIEVELSLLYTPLTSSYLSLLVKDNFLPFALSSSSCLSRHLTLLCPSLLWLVQTVSTSISRRFPSTKWLTFVLFSPDLDVIPMHRGEVDIKAIHGLGLGLPSEVLVTSFGVSKSVGLGIYIDFENWDGLLVSPAPSTDTPSVSFARSSSLEAERYSPLSSPPMLGTRLERPAPPQDSFWSEYAPMRTPPPSVLFVASGFPTPPRPGDDEHSTVATSMLASGSTLPSTESIASGLNLLCLDDEELGGYVPSADAAVGTGLGLSLADMQGPELVHTLHLHGLRGSSPPFEVSSGYLSDDELDGEDSPLSQVHFIDCTSAVGLGLDLSERDAVDAEEGVTCDALEVGESSASSTSVGARGLGFDSPFWAQYAVTLPGDA